MEILGSRCDSLQSTAPPPLILPHALTLISSRRESSSGYIADGDVERDDGEDLLQNQRVVLGHPSISMLALRPGLGSALGLWGRLPIAVMPHSTPPSPPFRWVATLFRRCRAPLACLTANTADRGLLTCRSTGPQNPFECASVEQKRLSQTRKANTGSRYVRRIQ
ncbi:unnamed protein product [Pleuronectes platessa]|uniref:Uncharacterized protein n=1 Tax=Pleuronectes platessa TaxID=8262 RepID=A0A9N7V499_PLEPL|nr:unnamed protein product [Pleuronectes platessa]